MIRLSNIGHEEEGLPTEYIVPSDFCWLTAKEDIARKPAYPRVLHNVLKGVESSTQCWASVVDYGLNPFSLWEVTHAL
ncbi:jg17355 [Pararge aegeria aegeria]|uniref:Jg17355 protein n=1 Tax=Pararge aegeria aegeria TaxID=348720 RepID=A0A8S4RRV7_9NEOP|nr:jg17355 [Pararge aegeria aegeria]